MSWIECDMCLCYNGTCPHCNGRGYVYDREESELPKKLRIKTKNDENDENKNETK